MRRHRASSARPAKPRDSNSSSTTPTSGAWADCSSRLPRRAWRWGCRRRIRSLMRSWSILPRSEGDRFTRRRGDAESRPLTFALPGRTYSHRRHTMTRIRYAALAAVLGLASISAAHAAIESPIHRSFNVRPGGTITIDADLGDIKVTSGGSNVSVDVIRRAKTSSQTKANDLFDDLAVTFTPEGDSVRIRAKYDQPSSWFNGNNDLEVRFVVSVPSQYNVDLRTSAVTSAS